MELSNSKIKKFFFSKERFSYISGNGALHFPASAPKIYSKKVFIFLPKKSALINFLIFSQKTP